jgi:hypothetical protein
LTGGAEEKRRLTFLVNDVIAGEGDNSASRLEKKRSPSHLLSASIINLFNFFFSDGAVLLMLLPVDVVFYPMRNCFCWQRERRRRRRRLMSPSSCGNEIQKKQNEYKYKNRFFFFSSSFTNRRENP